MVRAIAGLFARQVFPLGLAAACILLFAWLAIVVASADDPELSGWRVFATGTRLATMLLIVGLLLLEGPRLKGQILQRSRAIEQITGSPPGRADRVVLGLMGAAFVTVVVLLMFAVRFVWSGDCGSVVEFAVSWIALRAALWLVVGRCTSWWLGRRLRRLGGGVAGPSVFPLLVATQVALALAFLWVRPPATLWVQATALAVRHAVPDPSETVRNPSAPASRGLAALLRLSTDELLVRLGPDDSIDEIRPVLVRHGATASRAAPSAPMFSRGSRTWVVRVSAGSTQTLIRELHRDRENIEVVELNPKLASADVRSDGPCPSSWGSVTNDPLSGGQRALRESGVDHVLARRLVNRGLTRYRRTAPTVLAVIDRGVAREHEDLTGIVRGRRVLDNRHGTEVAGIAAAVANNRRGMASLNTGGERVSVLSLPVFADADPGADDIADAIYEAVDDKARVIVMAFAARGRAPGVVGDAVAHASRSDVILVAAAGNTRERSADDHWPANLDGVVAVPALDSGRLAAFSSSAGDTLSIAAPGNDVCAPSPGGGYHAVDGSSMAAAFLAGVIADRRTQCPRDRAEEILLAIAINADPPSGPTGMRLNAAALDTTPCARR